MRLSVARPRGRPNFRVQNNIVVDRFRPEEPDDAAADDRACAECDDTAVDVPASILSLLYDMRTYAYIITVVRSRKTSVEYNYTPVVFFLSSRFHRLYTRRRQYFCGVHAKNGVRHSTSSGARPTVS